MNGAPLFPCTLGSTTFDYFPSFPYLQKLFTFGRFAWQHTQVVICAILRGPQARVTNYSPSFFLLPCTKFFLVAPDKKMPLANRGAQFCTQFQGHKQQQRK